MSKPVSRARPARVVAFDRLTAKDLAAWCRLRSGNPSLDSPYFHPGFAAAVHSSGQRVDVIIEDDEDGQVAAMLPCHRFGSRLRPVGWPGADFQGPIVPDGSNYDPVSALTGRAREYAFDHLLDGLASFEPWVETKQQSPFLDVTGGLDGYLSRASRSAKDNLGQARRRANKAAGLYGSLKWDVDNRDPAALDQIIELKRRQYAATGARDFFSDPRRVKLLHNLLGSADPAFGGIMSTIFAGPDLLAGHFGLRADRVLHWWFPVYDPRFASLAPGWILLRQLIIASPEINISRIDLGRGDDEYKRRAKTGAVMVAQGTVSRGAGRRVLRHAQVATLNRIKSSPLAPQLRKAVHRARAYIR